MDRTECVSAVHQRLVSWRACTANMAARFSAADVCRREDNACRHPRVLAHYFWRAGPRALARSAPVGGGSAQLSSSSWVQGPTHQSWTIPARWQFCTPVLAFACMLQYASKPEIPRRESSRCRRQWGLCPERPRGARPATGIADELAPLCSHGLPVEGTATGGSTCSTPRKREYCSRIDFPLPRAFREHCGHPIIRSFARWRRVTPESCIVT